MIIYSVLFVSIVCHIIAVSYIYRLKQKPLSKDANELLSDLLTRSNTIIRIQRLDPNDMLVRSPRDL